MVNIVTLRRYSPLMWAYAMRLNAAPLQHFARLRAAPYTSLDATFPLHGRVCGYALTPRLARAFFHTPGGCVPGRLRWTR